MSKVQSKYAGFVGQDGVPTLLAVGDEFDAEHPLVQSHPDLFTEPRRSPGRPAGSKNKPSSDD